MKQIILAFTILTLNTCIYSAIPDGDIKKGLDHIYNLKFDLAETHFTSLQSKYPDDLRPSFYLAQIYFYKALLTRDEGYYLRFLDLSDKAIELYEERLDKNEKDYDAMYYLGQAHSYRSLLMLNLNKNLIGAAFSGKTGYGMLLDLVNEKPDYYDAYMGLGLYKIAIGFVPGKYQWLLSIIGFDGNLKEGRNMLRTAYEKGKFTSVEARVYLAFFSIREREEQNFESVNIMRDVVAEYPESPVFKLFLASLLQQMNSMDESISLTNAAIEQNTNSLQNEMKKGAYSLLGTAYFRKNDFEKAAFYFEEHIKYVHPEDRYNVSLFLLGLSYEMMGDRQRSLASYQRVREDFVKERDGEGEKFFLRLAKQRASGGFTKFDSLLVIAMNIRECGRLDEAEGMYNELINMGKSTSITQDDLAKVYFELGNIYFLKGSYQQAEVMYRKCIDSKSENETWLKPHAMFELGKIYSLQGKASAANDMFAAMKDEDDFDFEVFLDMRLINFQNK